MEERNEAYTLCVSTFCCKKNIKALQTSSQKLKKQTERTPIRTKKKYSVS